MLPVLGGSPNVWISSNLFFQVLLLSGYYVSTILSRIHLSRYIYLAFILVAAFILPSQLKVDIGVPIDEPTVWVFKYLLISVGLPALLLCTVAPLLQFWYGKAMPGSNPYLLYAASNLGSFLGILVYPLLIEPRLELDIQFQLWRSIYLILLATIVTIIFTTFQSGNWDINFQTGNSEDNDYPMVEPSLLEKLRWIFFAAIPVSLSLSLTSYITQDIGSFPLLWVLPLGLYLLSYIRGFKPLNKPTFLASPYKYVLIALVFFGFNSYLPIPPQVKFLLSTILFYRISLNVHNYLYQFRPHVFYLPQFYLFTSLGGVAGGLINAVVAPTSYKFTIEYAICLILCLLINPITQVSVTTHEVRSKLLLGSGFSLKQYNIQPSILDKNTIYIILLAIGAIEYILFWGDWHQPNFKTYVGVLVPLVLFGIAILKLDSTKFQKAVVLTSLVGILLVFKPFGNYLFADRSYFGNLQVIRSDNNGGSRIMLHGITMHGFQSDSMMSSPPSGLAAPGLAYYTAVKEVVEKISDDYNRSIKIGMVGMGAGISAMYTSSSDVLDFYEIDPLVIKVATDTKYFTYINKSPAKINIIQGDARLSLSISTQKYDLLVLDAFSSDAIPTHLLTREAFEIYSRRMNPDGAILVHISNRYFDLSQVVAATVHGLGKDILRKDYNPTPENGILGEAQAKWLAVGLKETLNKYVDEWSEVVIDSDIKPWTDDYANLLGALNFLRNNVHTKNQ
ncbi:hypothetical protein NIES4071_102260 (plasmid) [Calothrix sp. NIES-4071]|nr:hypothetical protein NIES4071_102260 [Calothrix sp. NIES-4071]BAZ64607.1 hypothetical protein NIES4105_103400 [Calothrix sp. NIES-4105]